MRAEPEQFCLFGPSRWLPPWQAKKGNDVFTLVINYPADMDTLTRWSKALFTAWYLCGFGGLASLVAGVMVWASNGPLWAAIGLALLGPVFGAAMHALEQLMSEMDGRRHAFVDSADR